MIVSNTNVSNSDVIDINKLYKLMLDQSPFLVTFFDLNFNLHYLNSCSFNFFGLSLDEIKGKSVFDLIEPEAIDALKTALLKINIDNPITELEHQNTDSQGQTYWYQWNDRGIFNADGKLIGYQSIGQNITKKKDTEENLKLSRSRLNRAQQLGMMGDWFWDIKKDLTHWSDQTYRLLGLKPGEIEPEQDYYQSCILPEYRENFLLQHKNLFDNVIQELNLEYPIKVKEKNIWLRDKGRIEYEDGKPVRVTGTILDITASKELQLSLEEHIAIEETLLDISNIFMLAEQEKTGSAINETMKILGSKFKADRTYLVLNDTAENEVYQWLSTDRTPDETIWDETNKETPAVFAFLKKKEGLAIPAMKSGGEKWRKDYKWFKSNNIEAFITVQLYHNNVPCGYLCMEGKNEKPHWTDVDFSFLKIVGEMCVNARESIKSRLEIEHEKELLSVTLMSIGDGFILLAPDGRLEMINNSAVELLGLFGKNLQGEYIRNVIKIKDADGTILSIDILRSQLQNKRNYSEALYSHPNGSNRTISYSCSSVPGLRMDEEGIALIFRDITEERNKQNEIAYLGLHDSLTGLYNRAYMDAELKRMDTERQLPLSIITGDVNGLKLVNDVFGHEEGDKLLVTIAEILLGCCREEDVISRWGGDEFSIILPGTDQKTADRICTRIKKACEMPEETRIIPNIALGSATKTSADEEINGTLKEAEDRMYRQKLLDDRSVRSDIISSLKNSMFEKSYETEEHTQRMLKITEVFGKALKLPLNDQSDLNLLAIMHDMGKIAVSSSILGKAGKLTDEEWEEIKRHPEAGYRIAQSSQELISIADYILSHHERWDGSGYPRGLQGKEIPEPARIISIVDTYDVMTQGRVYKAGVSSEMALEEIERCSGSQFDPNFTRKFIRMMRAQLK